jgi:hypothetical protein
MKVKTAPTRQVRSHRKAHDTPTRIHSGNGHATGADKAIAPGLSPKMATWLAKPKANLIGGKWVPAVNGKTFEVVNPADGTVISNVPDSG